MERLHGSQRNEDQNGTIPKSSLKFLTQSGRYHTTKFDVLSFLDSVSAEKTADIVFWLASKQLSKFDSRTLSVFLLKGFFVVQMSIFDFFVVNCLLGCIVKKKVLKI